MINSDICRCQTPRVSIFPQLECDHGNQMLAVLSTQFDTLLFMDELWTTFPAECMMQVRGPVCFTFGVILYCRLVITYWQSINDSKMLSSIHHTHTHHIRWSVILSVSALICVNVASVFENCVKQKCVWSYWTSIIHLVTQSFNLNVDCYVRYPSLRTHVSK